MKDYTKADQQLHVLCQIIGKANRSSNQLLGYAQADSEVRIWPEHFDTGVYFEYNGTIGIGFGLVLQVTT